MKYIHTIDIANPELVPETVQEVLDEAVDVIRWTHKWRAIKVIHGEGDIKNTASSKNVVRNWANRNEKHFKGIVPGEIYNEMNPIILEMQKTCGTFADPDLGIENSNLTLIWIK